MRLTNLASLVAAVACATGCANAPTPAPAPIARLSEQQSQILAERYAVGPEQQNQIRALTRYVQQEQDRADAIRAQLLSAQTYVPYYDGGYGYGCGFYGCLGDPYAPWPSVGFSFGYYRGWRH